MNYLIINKQNNYFSFEVSDVSKDIIKMRHTNKTLPEAQRTQGIESVTWMIFFSQNNFKLISVRNMIQVIDSMPWVRCASGNVFFFSSICLSRVQQENSPNSLWCPKFLKWPMQRKKETREILLRNWKSVCPKFQKSVCIWHFPQ